MGSELHIHMHLMHKIALLTSHVETYYNMARTCKRYYAHFMNEETIERCIKVHITVQARVTTFLGVKHSVRDRPALTEYEKYQGGTVRKAMWYCFGLVHRPEKRGPAVMKPYVQEYNYYRYGKLHTDSDNIPTISKLSEQHFVVNVYYRHGVKHRDRGKEMMIESKKTGQRVIKRYTHGQLHSVDYAPAVIYPDGKCEHYKHGVLHRDDGPAVYWMRDGKVSNACKKMSYQDGKCIKWIRSTDKCFYFKEHLLYMDKRGIQRCKGCPAYAMWTCE